MHRTTKRLASALLAAVLCAAAALPAGADYEPWTYEVDDLMGSYGVEYYGDVGFTDPTAGRSAARSPASAGVSTQSAGTSGGVSTQSAVTQPATGGKAVVVTGEQPADAAETPVNPEISVYSVDGFNVYSAGEEYTGEYFTVTIPAEVEVNTTTNKGTLSISSVLTKCSNLVITIASAGIDQENGKYYLTCETGTEQLEYKMAHNAIVFSKDKDNTDEVKQSQNIDIRVVDEPTVSGTYTDTLTFTITPREYTTDTTRHVLTFDLNTKTDTAISDDEVIISTTSKVITSGEEYGALPTPHRDGFDFEGWYTTTATNSTQVYATTTAGNDDVTVYAHWKPHTLTIKYHNDGADWITWSADPQTDHYGAYLNKDVSDYQGYELVRDSNNNNVVTGLKLDTSGASAGDVTLVEIESYGESWTNGANGVFDVYRWKKGNTQASGTTWALYRGGSGKISEYYTLDSSDVKCTSAQVFAAYVDRMEPGMNLLQRLKESDVVLDLYLVWPAGAKTASESDADTLLPSWDETTKPVVIEMPATDLDDAADTKADTKKDTAADTTDTTESTAKADTKADDTAKDTDTIGSIFDDPEQDITPDDLMITDADDMLARMDAAFAMPYLDDPA